MSEHPLYAMWRDRLRREHEYAEQNRIGWQVSREIRESRDRYMKALMDEIHERESRRLPWWDLAGRIERWLA